MKLLGSSFLRALAYCLHPKVIALSLLPVLLLVVGVWVMVWLWWEPALQWVVDAVTAHPAASAWVDWLQSWGFVRLRAVLGPAIVLLVFLPLMVLVSLLVVAFFMVPALVHLVAARRFAGLQALQGGGFWAGLVWSGASTAFALLLLVLTLPLWLIPPLAVLCPVLIWGWLTYRIMSYDVLSQHASVLERRALMQQHRLPLYAMGVVTGLLGAAPALLWVSGAMWVAMAPVLLPLAVWTYALTFAFSGLWFAHFLLEALQEWRARPEWSPNA